MFLWKIWFRLKKNIYINHFSLQATVSNILWKGKTEKKTNKNRKQSKAISYHLVDQMKITACQGQLFQQASDPGGMKYLLCIPLQWPKQDMAVLHAATAFAKTKYGPWDNDWITVIS